MPAEGSTENATLVRELLVGLRECGLDVTRPLLVVIDGSKALRRAVLDVSEQPVIQRCQLHKVRNVKDKLPERLRRTVERRMRQAYPESTDGLGCAGCRARNGRFGGCGSGWWRW